MTLAQIQGVNSPITQFVDSNNSLRSTELVNKILYLAIGVAGLVFFIMLIISGFSYLTAAGDPTKIQAATKRLTSASLGLFLVLCTFFIAQLLQVILGIQFI